MFLGALGMYTYIFVTLLVISIYLDGFSSQQVRQHVATRKCQLSEDEDYSATTNNDKSRYISDNTKDDDIETIIRQRMTWLKRVGESQGKPSCRRDNIITLENEPYGRSSNHFLALIHALWIADTEKLNGTVTIPAFMQEGILTSFKDVQHTVDYFCGTLKDRSKESKPGMIVSSEELMELWRFFPYYYNGVGLTRINTTFILNNETLYAGGSLWIRFLSSLWSQPLDHIVDAGIWLIKNKLGNTLDYTTVHKRNFEGSCSRLMFRVSAASDFSDKEIPMDKQYWSHLYAKHPLCHMAYDFVFDVMVMNHRTNQSLFISHDGDGGLDDYQAHKHHAITSNDIDTKKFPMFTHTDSRKFLDMFLAIHGDFFILNPRSSFSWCVYVVRVALGLSSVPVVKNRDLFFQSDREYHNRMDSRGWVGYANIIDTMEQLRKTIKD